MTTMTCEDCGMINPPDDHECEQYEARMKAERDAKPLEQIVLELEGRIEYLEQRVAQLSAGASYFSPWRKSI